jgi:PPK2 family polyphosphate:nucleotide phosphotransferase
MKIHAKDYRAPHGKKVRLARWATKVQPVYKSDKGYKDLLVDDVRRLSELQRTLYASNSYSVLLIFQAMDAAGKDGAISHVMSGVNPEGCDVHSFKQPSAEELGHDFLWRTTCRLPGRGRIGIFNRSYYEEVLVVRVHPEDLVAEGLPRPLLKDKSLWEGRFESIVNFEKHLDRNGTRVIKIFLHLSKAEQRRRLLDRIDEPDKNWKFSLADVRERRLWGKYMRAYEDCITQTTTRGSPWYIVPADDKLNARLIVSRIVTEAIRDLGISMPEVTKGRRRELKEIRRQLSG